VSLLASLLDSLLDAAASLVKPVAGIKRWCPGRARL
jgi:hypothetical protein